MTDESRLSIDPPVALLAAQVLKHALDNALVSDDFVSATAFGRRANGKWYIASSIPLTDSVRDEFDLFLQSGILEGRQDLLSDPAEPGDQYPTDDEV